MNINGVLLVLLLSTSTALAGKGLTTLKNGLGVIALTATLASSTVADDGKLLWQRVTSESPAVHRATFLMDVELEGHRRQIPLVMVGKDHSGRHLFVGARVLLLNLPVLNEQLIFDKALSIDLYGYDGLIDSNFAIDEISFFLRPNKRLGRPYDLSVLAIETQGDTLDSYPTAQTAGFPALTTPLDIVIYEPGGRGWRAYHSNCHVRRHIDQWLAASDCVVPLMENEVADLGTPLFINSTDKLVGLQLEPSGVEFPAMIAVPEELQVFLDIKLSIDPLRKLPTMWSKIKTGRY